MRIGSNIYRKWGEMSITGDQLYDLTKAHLQASVTPFQAYARCRLMLMFHLMEKVPQPTVWQWRKDFP